MKRLLQWLLTAYLRERIDWWDHEIAIEQQRHVDFPVRMRSWTAQRQEFVNQLERIQRPSTARTEPEYHRGPCLQQRKPTNGDTWL